MSEQSIEKEIQEKGLNAPRLNPAHIDAQIVAEQYHVFVGTTLTVCCLTLRNGFHVTGESAAASPENFNLEIGRKIARENARDKIWALEGYLLKENLSRANNGKEEADSYTQRAVDEKTALDEKAYALTRFISHSRVFVLLEPEKQEQLKQQCEIMWQYSEILGKRIAGFHH